MYTFLGFLRVCRKSQGVFNSYKKQTKKGIKNKLKIIFFHLVENKYLLTVVIGEKKLYKFNN